MDNYSKQLRDDHKWQNADYHDDAPAVPPRPILKRLNATSVVRECRWKLS